MPWAQILLLLLLATASAAVWTAIFRRRVGDQPLVAFEPRHPPPWNLLDLLMVALVFAACQLTAGLVASLFSGVSEANAASRAVVDPLAEATRLVLVSLARLATLVLGCILIRLRAAARWSDLGVDTSRLAGDLGLGLAAFAAIAPLLYALQALLTYLYPGKHPLIELLEKQPDPQLLLVSGLSAVLVAPLVEEFLFRVLLQGWLESLEPPPLGAAPGSGAEPATVPAESGPSPLPMRPIVISSLLFALVHVGHGPAPVALFFLGLALGYLYRQTHRLAPCVALHFSVNAYSLLLLWLDL